MQYALFKIDDEMLLLDIHEHVALMDNCDSIADIEEDEDSMPLKIVYGSYKPQRGYDADAAEMSMAEIKGYALGHVMGKTCRAVEFCDFVAYAPLLRGHAIDIPFAGLIRTHVEMPSVDRQAVTAFARYFSDMTPATNILNRPGLFAFKAQEQRVRGEVTQANWRTFVDENRALRAAHKAV